MKKLVAFLAASLLLVLAPAAALATHKNGHIRPPACEVAQGAAPEKNKHCYPPAESVENSGGRALGPNFPDGQPSNEEGGGIAFWMVALGAAGLGGAGLLLWRSVRARGAAPKPS